MNEYTNKISEQKIALFIDCDNISHNAIEEIINELSNYGVTYIKNAYGDWKKPLMKGWQEELQKFAIKPIQQFAYTKQKNATDMAMVIDIMDLLYENKIDAFAIATSDSDFTPIVMRILREGMEVYGFGEDKTPDALVKACSRFIYTDKAPSKESTKGSVKIIDDELINLLNRAIDEVSEDDGWANIASVGKYMSRRSSFSPKNYGYKKLGELLKNLKGYFATRLNNEKTIMYVKNI
jgi:uncharacterized protein (TIGR00288 family)